MVSWGINPVFTGLSPTHGQVTYALLTRAPLATRGAAARLACVRPVASVHPEPGSNSSLYFFIVCLMLAIQILKKEIDLSSLLVKPTSYLYYLLFYQSSVFQRTLLPVF